MANRGGSSEVRARALLGVTYLVVMALLVALCIQIYRKAMPWQHQVTLTVVTRSAGLQLQTLSDVKLQGMRVGEVRSISSDGRTATIRLGIDPSALHLIPADVDAAIVPTTLFGQKYVDLRAPLRDSTAPIRPGTVIHQSATSVEIGAILSRLGPLLKALDPARLSVVLNTLAGALDGKGAVLARTIDQLGATLHAVNPHLRDATGDLRRLAVVAHKYADEGPAIKQILEASATVSSNLLTAHEGDLAALLNQVTSTADTARQVLDRNGEQLIRLTGRALPVTQLLKTYARAIPCLITGLRTSGVLGDQTFGARGPYLSVTIDMVARHTPYTYPADLPGHDASDALPASVPNARPHCPQFTAEVKALADPAPYSLSSEGQTLSPSTPPSPRSSGRTAVTPTPPSDTVERARAALARATAARLLGVAPSDVPSYAQLLVEPLLSGVEVK